MSHSLIVPRHIADAKLKARTDPGIEVKPRVEGAMHNSDEWFAAEKRRIREAAGWALDKFDMKLNRVLVAIFVRPKEMALAGGSSLIVPDTVLNEDLYQGVTGLVLKLGPRCFEDSDVMTWTEADRFKPDDWVLLRRGDGGGFRLRLNGVECIHFESERGIKAVIPRPDVVY